jgi:hypothetical protein
MAVAREVSKLEAEDEVVGSGVLFSSVIVEVEVVVVSIEAASAILWL